MKKNTKSIITDDFKHCFVCGVYSDCLHVHHVMEGNGNRQIADKYGLTIPLCYECHEGTNGVHRQPKKYEYLKGIAQECFEKTYDRTEWMKHFKNYL